MKPLLYEKFTKYEMLRTVLLGIMGIVTFLFPDFLLSGMVYVISGYMVLNGALSIADFFLGMLMMLESVFYCFRVHMSLLFT